ncbi:hypothetical protein MTO96_035651 [Rhipicephalus appendiculatus]
MRTTFPLPSGNKEEGTAEEPEKKTSLMRQTGCGGEQPARAVKPSGPLAAGSPAGWEGARSLHRDSATAPLLRPRNANRSRKRGRPLLAGPFDLTDKSVRLPFDDATPPLASLEGTPRPVQVLHES